MPRAVCCVYPDLFHAKLMLARAYAFTTIVGSIFGEKEADGQVEGTQLLKQGRVEF